MQNRFTSQDLFIAAKLDDLRLLHDYVEYQQFINQPINIDYADDDGSTAFILALKSRNTTIAIELLKLGANVNQLIEVPSEYPSPYILPLKFAIEHNLYLVAKFMLTIPTIIIMPHRINSSHLSAFKKYLYDDITSIKCRKLRMQSLKDATGKGKDAESHPLYLLMSHRSGTFPSKTLLKLNDFLDCIRNNYPLHHAAMLGSIDDTRVVLAEGEVDVNERTSQSHTALELAISKNAVAVVDALIAAGADVNQTTKEGYSPLRLAAFRRYHEIIIRLLAVHGVNFIQNDLAHPFIFIETKEFLYTHIMSIEDIPTRTRALLDAAGKGLQGVNHPMYVMMKMHTPYGERIVSAKGQLFVLNKVNKALGQHLPSSLSLSTNRSSIFNTDFPDSTVLNDADTLADKIFQL